MKVLRLIVNQQQNVFYNGIVAKLIKPKHCSGKCTWLTQQPVTQTDPEKQGDNFSINEPEPTSSLLVSSSHLGPLRLRLLNGVSII